MLLGSSVAAALRSAIVSNSFRVGWPSAAPAVSSRGLTHSQRQQKLTKRFPIEAERREAWEPHCVGCPPARRFIKLSSVRRRAPDRATSRETARESLGSSRRGSAGEVRAQLETRSFSSASNALPTRLRAASVAASHARRSRTRLALASRLAALRSSVSTTTCRVLGRRVSNDSPRTSSAHASSSRRSQAHARFPHAMFSAMHARLFQKQNRLPRGCACDCDNDLDSGCCRDARETGTEGGTTPGATKSTKRP